MGKVFLSRRRGGGEHTQLLANLLMDPAAPGLIPSVPETISEDNFFVVAEVSQRHKWAVA